MVYFLYVKGYNEHTTLDELVIYFQSKESGGGDIDDESCTVDKDIAKIAFEEEEDLVRVVEKQHTLKGSKLTISRETFKAKEPQEQPKAKPRKRTKNVPESSSEKPATDKVNTVIVSGFNPQASDTTVELFFESKKRSGGGEIAKFQRVDPQVAHITFTNSQVASRVLAREHLEIDGYRLEVKAEESQNVPQPSNEKPVIREVKTVIVSGICPQTTDDTLQCLFENPRRSGGGDIETFERIDMEVAHITFTKSQVASRVLAREHLEMDGYRLQLKAQTLQNVPQASNELPVISEVKTVIVSGIGPQTTDDTLQCFFENSRRSGGGDIEMFKRIDPQVAHITFTKPEVVLKVVAREHLEVDGYRLELKADKARVIFPPDKMKLYVENLDTKTSKDSLTNYVEVVTGIGVKDSVFGNKNNAMVELEAQPDMKKTMEKAKKKKLDGAVLKISNPPVCHSILVTGFSEKTTKDSIELKFENPKYGGGEILDIVYQQEHRRATISYYNPKVIDTVMSQQHCLNDSILAVRRYHPCVEVNDMSAVKTNKKVIALKPDVMEYVSNNCREKFQKSFGFNIDEANYNEGKEELILTTAATGKPTEKQIKEIENFFKKFTIKEIKLSDALFANSRSEVEEILAKTTENFQNKAAVSIDDEKKCIVLTGKQDKLGQVEKALRRDLEELERKNQVVTRNISLDQDKLMLIFSVGFEEKFESESNIEVKINAQAGTVMLKGSQEMVDSAQIKVLEAISRIKEEYIDLNIRQQDILESGGLQNLNDGLRKRKMKALICLDKSKPKRAKVELFDQEKFDDVNRYVSNQLSEECFTVAEESVALLRDEKWRTFQEKLANDYGIKIFKVGNAEVDIWLTGEQSKVKTGYARLEEFVKLNTTISESIALPRVGRFLSKFYVSKMKNIEEKLKDQLVKLLIDGIEGSFVLQGTKAGVRKAKIMLLEIIDDIPHEKILVKEPGMKKFLQKETGKSTVWSIENRYNCTINMTDGSESQHIQVVTAIPPRVSTTNSVLLCSYETEEKILLKVYQADITNHPCDVIVNAANDELKHVGGLARMILDKGGKEIQEECNQYVKHHGKLSPGQCYNGIPGKLQCKRVVHAVAPRWDNTNRVRHKQLLQFACESSLESAKKYSTIALPALGSGIFGVPKEVCAGAMVGAAVKFSAENKGEHSLQEIHFVNNDSQTAQIFLKELRQRFGSQPTFDETMFRPTRGRTIQKARQSTRKHLESEAEGPAEAILEPKKTSNGDTITTDTKTTISVIIGDLSTHEADVLVNTTSESLQLGNNPCSQALSNEAGPVLQQECNKIGKLKAGDTAFTSGGKLMCKHVCHVTCTQYNNGEGEKVLRAILQNSLNETQTRGLVSIAFPAIGTGVLKFPHRVTAKICFEEAKKFGKKNPKSSVKEIHFVVFSQDQASIKAFQDELKKQPEWGKGTSKGVPSRRALRKPVAAISEPRRSEEESLIQASREDKEHGLTQATGSSQAASAAQVPTMTEGENGEICIFVQNGVTVRVLKGDITQETTDVIAHLSNPGMSMGGGVARAIIRSGGKEIERETEREKPVRMHDVLLTKAGNLQAEYIAHMAAPDRPDSSDIEKCVKNCLQAISRKKCRSISLPAIATGQLSMPAEKSAKAMLTAIIPFLQTNVGPLETVRIVVHDSEIFTKFSNAVKKLLSEEDGQSTGFVRGIINSIWGFFRSPSESQGAEQEGPSLSSPLFLEIYADKIYTLKEVAKSINKMISEQMKEEVIKNDEIGKLTESDVSKIKNVAEEHNVEANIKKNSNRIVVCGHSDDISTVILQVNQILNAVKLAEHERDTAEIVSQGVQWFWIDTDGTQVEYDLSTNSIIEKAHVKKKKSISYQLQEGECEIVFEKMQETNKKTGQKTEVVRKLLKAKAVISIPDYWESQPKDASGKELPLHVVLLDPANNTKHSDEYKKISDGFLQTAGNHTIQKIERIQNPALFKLYALKKQSMDERDGSNEKMLYHGTAGGNVKAINQNGLNRSYTPANGRALGHGIYFARDARLSVGYTKPDASGDRVMYAARVATGFFTTGDPTMIVPPERSGNYTYDSVVNNVSAPTIFVLFYDNQYYPEYLITFR